MSAEYVTHEHAFSEFRRVGEIEGIAFDEAAEVINKNMAQVALDDD